MFIEAHYEISWFMFFLPFNADIFMKYEFPQYKFIS